MKYFFFSCLMFCTSAAVYAQEPPSSGYDGGLNTAVKVLPQSSSFLLLGDWGRNGQYYQRAVAGQMAITAATVSADFVLAAGDNFYPGGVRSVQDPQWHYSFEDVYRAHALQQNWYVALGNHDYKGNIQAQLDYSTISRRWQMPAAYYSKKIKLKSGGLLLLVVIDTTPLLDSYYGQQDESSENVARQDTAAQMRWLQQVLADTDTAIRWRFVLGHHPMYSGGKRKQAAETRQMAARLAPLFDRYRVDAYLCGHEHDLQIIRPEGHYSLQLLSGSGAEVRPSGNTEGSLFSAAAPGFMVCSFSGNQCLVQVVHADGHVLFSTSLFH